MNMKSTLKAIARRLGFQAGGYTKRHDTYRVPPIEIWTKPNQPLSGEPNSTVDGFWYNADGILRMAPKDFQFTREQLDGIRVLQLEADALRQARLIAAYLHKAPPVDQSLEAMTAGTRKLADDILAEIDAKGVKP